MHHIIYLSRATASFSDADLQELLLVARTRNALLNVTGVLLYGNGQFMQVLEGEEQAVRALYEDIRRDTRHRDVVAYADKEIEQRAFVGWAMAFHTVTPAQLVEVLGYIVPSDWVLDKERLRQADAHLIELLRSFVLPA